MRNEYTYLTALLALFLWVGIPFYIKGVGMQATHVTTFILVFVFTANKILAGNPVLFAMVRPLFLLTIWIICSLFLIITAGLISTFNAQDIVEVFRFLVGILVGISIIIVISGVVQEQADVSLVLKWVIIGGVISALAACLGVIHPGVGAITLNKYGRGQGFLLHPNQLGIMLGATIPIVTASLAGNYGVLRNWFFLALLAVGLVVSGSKTNILITALLGPLAMVIVSFLKPDISQRYKSVIWMMVVLLLSGFIAYLALNELAPKTLQNMMNVMEDPAGYRSMVSRQQIWAGVIKVAGTSPLIGLGAGNTWLYLGSKHAHNVFLEYFFTMGLIGLFALLFFLVSLFYVCVFSYKATKGMPLEQRAETIGIIIAIVSYITSNQLSESFGGTTINLLWVLIALLINRVNLWLWSQEL